MDASGDDAAEERADPMVAQAHEEGLAYFIESRWRPRFRESLANGRRREKLLDSLNHFRHLDERFADRLADGHQQPAFLLDALRHLGAPRLCYIMSDVQVLDGLEIPLVRAVSLVIEEASFGTFISCVPGELAYFQDEHPGDCWILSRRGDTSRTA
jgi:hypothetical protein